MSEVVIPAGYGLCTVLMSVTGRTKLYTTSFGYNLPAGADVDNAQAISDIIHAAGGMFATANIATTYFYKGVHVRQQGDTLEYSFEYNISTQGTQSISPPPANGSVLVKKNSSLSGKKNRGRFYLPPFGVTDADVDQNGNIGSASVAFLQGYADSTLAALDTGGFPMVILHHGAGAPTVVESLTVESTIATQRRRIR